MFIGYTTGGYVIVHIGHLNMIRRVKEQCDYLSVEVGKDELVQHDQIEMSVILYEECAMLVAVLKYGEQVVFQPGNNKVGAWGRYYFNFFSSEWISERRVV